MVIGCKAEICGCQKAGVDATWPICEGPGKRSLLASDFLEVYGTVVLRCSMEDLPLLCTAGRAYATLYNK
jgi:uncharacterized protein YqkB